MANRFKNKMMRSSYDSCLQMFIAKHRTLFYDDGSKCHSNGVGNMFWMGYEGKTIGRGFIDVASKNTLAYAYWRAGQDAAKIKQN